MYGLLFNWHIHFKIVAVTESTEVPKLKTHGQMYHIWPNFLQFDLIM